VPVLLEWGAEAAALCPCRSAVVAGFLAYLQNVFWEAQVLQSGCRDQNVGVTLPAVVGLWCGSNPAAERRNHDDNP